MNPRAAATLLTELVDTSDPAPGGPTVELRFGRWALFFRIFFLILILLLILILPLLLILHLNLPPALHALLTACLGRRYVGRIFASGEILHLALTRPSKQCHLGC